MLILPLIPVFILLAQNSATFLQYVSDADEILQVKSQVGNAVDLSILVQKLQEERAAVIVVLIWELASTDMNIQTISLFKLFYFKILRRWFGHLTK